MSSLPNQTASIGIGIASVLADLGQGWFGDRDTRKAGKKPHAPGPVCPSLATLIFHLANLVDISYRADATANLRLCPAG
jgi:hypothetical protein